MSDPRDDLLHENAKLTKFVEATGGLIDLVKKLAHEVEVTMPNFLHGDLGNGYVEQKRPARVWGLDGTGGTALTDEEYKMFDAVMKGEDFDA